MQIPDEVEVIARRVLSAVVKKDPEAMAGAMRAFPNEEVLGQGYRLALSVALFVIHDHYGRSPTPAEVEALAKRVAELEDWTDLRRDEFLAVLTGSYARTPLDHVLPMDRVILVSFVMAGSLLAAFTQPDRPWYDYLDLAEAVVEQIP